MWYCNLLHIKLLHTKVRRNLYCSCDFFAGCTFTVGIGSSLVGCVTVGHWFQLCKMYYCWMLFLSLHDVLLLDVIFGFAGCVTVGH